MEPRVVARRLPFRPATSVSGECGPTTIARSSGFERVAEAADVHRARVQCFAKRLRCRKIEPFDLVRQVFQLAGRFENAARLQRLVADLEHG
jgi:hypothetical protein